MNSFHLRINPFLIFFCLSASSLLHSQEVVTRFSFNPSLAVQYNQTRSSVLKKIPAPLGSLTLPFLDDFCKDNIYPDPSRWLDSNAYINRTYCIGPPTIGVATLDGLSKTGCPYDTSLVGNGSYPADTLTSRPIDLSAITDSSVYLSFYWQAQGKGNRPDLDDSLLLDFYNPTTHAWSMVWSKAGFPAISPPDSLFRLVMIQVKDTAFLKNGFQFRFRNYATISGNVDQWNIDYVLLDKNRNAGDTIFSDVAFVYNVPSLLKNYSAMPWEQYLVTDMKTQLTIPIRNNDTAVKNTSFTDTIYDAAGIMKANFNGGSSNVPSKKLYVNSGFNDYSLTYAIPAPVKPDSFYVLRCVIATSFEKNNHNDTLSFTQHFSNYYAYDDGTVEGGYGLKYCDGSPGQIAYRFSLNKPDTLVSVQMLFDWIAPNVHQQTIRVRVWNDIGGMPGAIIDSSDLTTPDYQFAHHSDWGNLVNMFSVFPLKTKLPLSGTFYVGFVEYVNPCSTLVNLGLDMNTNSSNQMFFNTGNGWTPSHLKASWMIRPVFGAAKGLLAVPEVETKKFTFQVFPNPAGGRFEITTGEMQTQTAAAYNAYGDLVYSSLHPPSHFFIDLTDQPDGIYFLRITDEKGVVHSQKLAVVR